MTGWQEAIPFVIIYDFFIDFYAIRDDSEITEKKIMFKIFLFSKMNQLWKHKLIRNIGFI